MSTPPYANLIIAILNCRNTSYSKSVEASEAYITSLIQNSNDPTIGRPFREEDISTIHCHYKKYLEMYIGATPFMIACEQGRKSVCEIMLRIMPSEQLHLNHVWGRTI